MFSANGMVISLTLVVRERICGQFNTVESIYAQIVKSVRARIKFIL
jgi:hypothetical protein